MIFTVIIKSYYVASGRGSLKISFSPLVGFNYPSSLFAGVASVTGNSQIVFVLASTGADGLLAWSREK